MSGIGMPRKNGGNVSQIQTSLMSQSTSPIFPISGPSSPPTQINEMLAGKYSLPVIQTALRVWNALDDCDRTDADDMIFLENNGLMTRGIVEDADDFEDLEVGETVWNFNAAGHALVAAIRSNLGAAP